MTPPGQSNSNRIFIKEKKKKKKNNNNNNNNINDNNDNSSNNNNNNNDRVKNQKGNSGQVKQGSADQVTDEQTINREMMNNK